MTNAYTSVAAWLCLCFGAFAQTLYTIDLEKRFQRIDNFGASDCWTAQSAGLYPGAKRNQMADWLFSTEVGTNGQPKGIGLSLWRFNVGAGSAEQGAASQISDASRRTECFLQADGNYDWSKQAGQRWFLQAARLRGVERFLAFCNSAPVHFTANGLANNKGRTKDGSYNLKPDRYEAFAGFLATVLAELGAREGVRFAVVSPFNEPEWEWDSPKQEGSPARVDEIARLVRLLDRKLSERRVDTEILVTESGQIDYLYRAVRERPEQDNQIEELFGPSSPNGIAGLPHVPKRLAGHSYWTETPNAVLRAKRQALRERLDAHGLGYWQTEVCIMQNDREIGGGGGRDLTMKTALYVARIIHYDLCVAGASAWQWWLGLSGGNYKDGLVYVTPNRDGTDGAVTDSRLLWTLGNFSRFIRPGAVRVGVSSPQADADDPEGLMVSAFLHEEGRLVTCVLVNMADRPCAVRLAVPGRALRKCAVYLTSDQTGATLQPQAGADPLKQYEVPARSVVTWIGRY
jgi:O-glycosyl hydrolase